jgi:hypothetical protein
MPFMSLRPKLNPLILKPLFGVGKLSPKFRGRPSLGLYLAA